jgi:hypothetical protein
MKVNFDREEQELVLVALNNIEEHYKTVYDKEGNYYWLQQISKLIAIKKKIVWSEDEPNDKYYHPVTKVEMSLKDYMELMFGKEFMDSKDKGTLKEY